MPVVLPPQKKSGNSEWLMFFILIALLGGGYFIYDQQQQKEQAIATRNARIEEARLKEEQERKRLAEEQGRLTASSTPEVTLMGTARTTDSTEAVATETETPQDDEPDTVTDEEPEDDADPTALGSTSAPTKGTGVFAEEDTSPPPFNLTAKGNKAKSVRKKLAKAVEEASKGDTFHDLQADLKRSLELAQPGFFADATTLPPYPDKENKLMRQAQGIYICLMLAAEVQVREEIPEKKHAKFVNWLLADKAIAARTFTYGLEHCDISDTDTATEQMGELRTVYGKDASSALKKIPTILKKAK